MWDANLGILLEGESDELQCNFKDIVPDVDWNPVYNMFAVCGFGQEFPVLLYAFERTDQELEKLDLMYMGQLTFNTDKRQDDLDDPQNQEYVAGIAGMNEDDNDSLKKRKRTNTPGRKSADFGAGFFKDGRSTGNKSLGDSNEYKSDKAASNKKVRFY